jgi:hypothetical protein
MNTLLPIKSQSTSITAFLLQNRWRRPISFIRFIRRADQINRRREVRGTRSGRDCRACEEEFCQ